MSHAPTPREPGGSAIVEPSSEVEVLDAALLQDLLESLAEPATVAALYRKFVENAAVFIRELRDQEDAARVETLHTLRGSAAMMGAKRLANLAMHLQTQLQGSSVQVTQASQALEGELARFRLAAAAQLLELGTSLDIPQ